MGYRRIKLQPALFGEFYNKLPPDVKIVGSTTWFLGDGTICIVLDGPWPAPDLPMVTAVFDNDKTSFVDDD